MTTLTQDQIRSALNRARTKMSRQTEALSATQAEVAIFEEQLRQAQTRDEQLTIEEAEQAATNADTKKKK